jgi:hypothetical protein
LRTVGGGTSARSGRPGSFGLDFRRPAGCPRAYCGCGASLYLLGCIIPALNLAANWPRMFPRRRPAPRMAAVQRHHVMVLERQHLGDVCWCTIPIPEAI